MLNDGPNSIDKTVLEHLYSGLVRPVPGTVNAEQIESDLALSWEEAKDQQSWTFQLRKGVEFHQGFGEFSADAVVFSLNRAKDKKSSRYYKSCRFFGDIKALDRYRSTRFVLRFAGDRTAWLTVPLVHIIR